MWSDAKNGGRESTVRLPPLIRVIADAFAEVAAATYVLLLSCCINGHQDGGAGGGHAMFCFVGGSESSSPVS